MQALQQLVQSGRCGQSARQRGRQLQLVAPAACVGQHRVAQANPQTFVENIAKADPKDYRSATHRIWLAPGQASYVELPVVGTRNLIRTR